MCTFAARRIAWSSGPVCLLVRFARWVLPAACLMERHHASALGAALFLGLVDGGFRLLLSRTSRSFRAELAGLIITSGFSTRVVPWPTLLAIQTWQTYKREDYVAVHYRSAQGVEVATCWEQDCYDELLAFVRASAARVRSSSGELRITTAGWRERGVWLPLVRHFAQDLAIAALIGFAIGFFHQTLLLGLLAAALSAGVAAGRTRLSSSTLVLRGPLVHGGRRPPDDDDPAFAAPLGTHPNRVIGVSDAARRGSRAHRTHRECT